MGCRIVLCSLVVQNEKKNVVYTAVKLRDVGGEKEGAGEN